MSIEQRLEDMGLKLNEYKEPIGKYSPMIHLKQENLIFLSGQLPILPNGELMIGKISDRSNIEVGKDAARHAVLSGLTVLKYHLNSLNYIKGVIQLAGFVNSSDDFFYHHLVIDGASELIAELFPREPFPSRMALGVCALPLNAMVELSMTLRLEK